MEFQLLDVKYNHEKMKAHLKMNITIQIKHCRMMTYLIQKIRYFIKKSN